MMACLAAECVQISSKALERAHAHMDAGNSAASIAFIELSQDTKGLEAQILHMISVAANETAGERWYITTERPLSSDEIVELRRRSEELLRTPITVSR